MRDVGGGARPSGAFQTAADDNDGIRAARTPAYDAGVAYVADTLEAAGYDVELDPFEFDFVPDAFLEQTAPASQW